MWFAHHQGPSDGATTLIIAIVVAGLVLVMLDCWIRGPRGKDR